jgi:hypothetical protein
MNGERAHPSIMREISTNRKIAIMNTTTSEMMSVGGGRIDDIIANDTIR